MRSSGEQRRVLCRRSRLHVFTVFRGFRRRVVARISLSIGWVVVGHGSPPIRVEQHSSLSVFRRRAGSAVRRGNDAEQAVMTHEKRAAGLRPASAKATARSRRSSRCVHRERRRTRSDDVKPEARFSGLRSGFRGERPTRLKRSESMEYGLRRRRTAPVMRSPAGAAPRSGKACASHTLAALEAAASKGCGWTTSDRRSLPKGWSSTCCPLLSPGQNGRTLNRATPGNR